ncbi:MAG: universal stress protein [Eubacteriales bacterium]|nr:universal stress protein [Bacillota bacterium]MBV1727967.1 universal stress protein [Desulforudis sp.]MDQ7789074.1 universal stress protein [Clostridia bacterium]MDZ4042176.1 universal stress protein [Eubacteriales bacterium]MBU4532992.1 universal stress protein [Bacillota bacterium]
MFKVLLAVDGSRASFRAAEYSLNLLRMNPAVELIALMVYPSGEEEFSLLMNEKLKETILEYMRQTTDQYRAFFLEQGFQINVEQLMGSPAESIVDYATRHQYDLIVAGTRGRRNLDNLILGSVAHKLVHLSSVPLMLVK